MKKLLLISLLAITILGCKKSNTANTPVAPIVGSWSLVDVEEKEYHNGVLFSTLVKPTVNRPQVHSVFAANGTVIDYNGTTIIKTDTYTVSANGLQLNILPASGGSAGVFDILTLNATNMVLFKEFIPTDGGIVSKTTYKFNYERL